MYVFNLSKSEDSRIIELDFDYITVTSFSKPGNYIKESITIRIEADAEISIVKGKQGEYMVVFHWFWREKYTLDHVTLDEAQNIKEAMLKIINVKKSVSNVSKKMEGIKVGKQIWAKRNLNVDVGDFSVEPLFQEDLTKQNGRLYSWHGAVKAAEIYNGWKIPSVEDYKELFEYLSGSLWKELTTSMNFSLSGVYSERLLELHGNPFAKAGEPLAYEVGGFYWTSDFDQIRRNGPKQRKLIRFNSLNKKIEPSSISELNRNMLSVRLIKAR